MVVLSLHNSILPLWLCTHSDQFPGVVLNPNQAIVNISSNDAVIGFDQVGYTIDEGAGSYSDAVTVTREISSQFTTISIRKDVHVANLSVNLTALVGSVEPTEQFIATVTTNSDQFPVVLDPNQVIVTISCDDAVTRFGQLDYIIDERAGTVMQSLAV